MKEPLRALALGAICAAFGGVTMAADLPLPVTPRSITELQPTAVIRLGKTADWVAITPDAVWAGSTGPNAVHRIDPRTHERIATVELGGEPCSGLAVGFGSVWVPLCGNPSTLAKVDAARNVVSAVFQAGPAASEGGVTVSTDSVWVMTGKDGALARIDPDSGTVRQTVRVPAGSYNPRFYEGRVWVTRADGAEITRCRRYDGRCSRDDPDGSGPRFLASGAGSIWTLNQGDGTLTRIDAHTRQPTETIALGTPGHGGDITFAAGLVWTTMWKVPLSAVDTGSGRTGSSKVLCQWVGRGGDSLGIGHDAIWLTDYHAGTISRLSLQTAVSHCRQPPQG